MARFAALTVQMHTKEIEMLVKAIRRGQIVDRFTDAATGETHELHRVIEPGTEFQCPDGQFAPLSTGPAGEQLGWMQALEPVTEAAQPRAPVGSADGLWPVGHHAHAQMRPTPKII
jgi:hypothetical protein